MTPWQARSRPTLARLGLAITVAALSAATWGCGAACPAIERWSDPETAVVTRYGGEIHYATSSQSGRWLPFEGGTVLHIVHNLGVVPEGEPLRELAFSSSPYDVTLGGGGSAAAAGNQALILRIDAQELVIKNDSCASYFIRVSFDARDPAAPDAGLSAGVDASVVADAPGDDAAADAVTGDAPGDDAAGDGPGDDAAGDGPGDDATGDANSPDSDAGAD